MKHVDSNERDPTPRQTRVKEASKVFPISVFAAVRPADLPLSDPPARCCPVRRPPIVRSSGPMLSGPQTSHCPILRPDAVRSADLPLSDLPAYCRPVRSPSIVRSSGPLLSGPLTFHCPTFRPTVVRFAHLPLSDPPAPCHPAPRLLLAPSLRSRSGFKNVALQTAPRAGGQASPTLQPAYSSFARCGEGITI